MKRLGLLAIMSAFAISGLFSAWFVAFAAILFFVAPILLRIIVWSFLFYKMGASSRFRLHSLRIKN